MPALCWWLVGGNLGGLVGLILLVRVACAAQAELAAGVLPRLPRAVPMETKLRQSLADGGRGLFGEADPNPLAYNLGHLPKAAVLLLEQSQNLVGRQRPVFLPCFGVNRETRVHALRLRCAGRLLGSLR